MKLSNLICNKSEEQPKTLRNLLAEECRAVSGGFGKECYYSYSSEASAS